MRELKNLSSDQIRKSFLDFFKSKDHHILASSSLIPDDPQLLFTVAGMVPFKKIFWGLESPKYSRVATVQKCLRTNDIENVGKTPRHQTFFEMLGNFSFGSYYKKEAIEYAWEFLTKWLEIPEDRLWVSIYKDDDEAYDIWTKNVGLDHKKIVRMGKEDNFWGPVGPSGPCGPDSEIFYDLRIPVKECPDPDKCTPACDCDRFLEVWNLVFTGLYQDENGHLGELERKNIDTGMGLERVSSVLQGVRSVFDTDLFVPFIQQAQKMFSVEYGKDQKTDTSMRVIADHVRSAAFLIADGVFPSNSERGYVLRRLIRRAVRHGKILGKDEPFLYKFVDTVNDVMGGFYPEIPERLEFIRETVKVEEERFFKTLDQGLILMEKIIASSSTISSAEAFKLHDTYGIPLDITLEMASEKGVKVDTKGFSFLMEKQREMARKNRGDKFFIDGIYESLSGAETKFVGYDSLELDATVMAMISNDGEKTESLSENEEGEIIFDRTPFYAEKGGQVGDTGICEFRGGNAKILNTYMKGALHIHKVKIVNGTLKTRTRVKLVVNSNRREAIARNHTATHLLHSSLRKILGEHVKQAGSLVSEDKLRFDFTHIKALSNEEIKKAEDMVNSVILKSVPVTTEIMSLKDAKKSGAMALFNEKYGDEVRVVNVGKFSKELCGGTHVSNVGNIGMFLIIDEHAVASGVRRIEAVTGWNSLNMARDLRLKISNMLKVLEVPFDDVESKVRSLLKENEKLKDDLLTIEQKQINEILREEIRKAKKKSESFIVFNAGKISPSDARNLADLAVNALENGIAIVIGKKGKKEFFVVKSTSVDVKAKEVAKAISEPFGGKGGGHDEMAQGGWNDEVEVEDIRKILRNILK